MGLTLGELRFEVGDQIGDVLVCTATTTSGSASQFTDEVTIVHGNNILRGRQAIMVAGGPNTDPANIGVIRTITGNSEATSTLDVRPAFASPPVAGDILQLYNTASGGPLIPQIHSAINRAIRDAGESALVEVTHAAGTFDYLNPTMSIPSNWYGFVGAEWQADDDTWIEAPWRNLDAVGRTVAVGMRQAVGLNGKTIQLRGYMLPPPLTSENDSTDINSEWLINRAAFHAIGRSAERRTVTRTGQSLALAATFKDDADATRDLTRNRTKPFRRLGG